MKLLWMRKRSQRILLKKQSAGIGIYQFHGIGAQFFKTSKETHQAFLDYLKKHEADYWVTTFSEAMNFIKTK